ncbi:(Fe-S)-binding protein [Dyella halodurans]|uniref:Glycolate oxidase iron-sulfur subunit n=1 Tax=Dyella halodurans TaxID=1920171 RepID=A0ABV9C7L9_9GAMM|nr:(Fe-S)-binding protein [Dyella halodurans]
MIGMPDEKPPLRIASLADQCVQCGLCLPVCPTYALDGNEAESPRGRIAIAAALARGEVEPTAALREHLDHCLGCLNCERVCPANVQYGELLVETRALLGPAPDRPRLLLALIKRPALWRLASRLARMFRLAHWKRRLAQRLPPASAWRAALGTLTDAPNQAALPTPPADAPSAEPGVALFPGCVASIEDAQAQQAAITLLRAAGYRVSLLPAFCCGAIDLHGGEAEGAERAAQRVRDAWQAAGAQSLVSVTPGCLGTLRRALPGVTVADPITLLSARANQLRFQPLARRVAVHLPCTQVNVARSETALLGLLRQVPQLEVKPLPRPPHCCGAAGSHMLEFPQRAARLRDATLEQIAALAPQQLLSSNIGCRLHLAAGMDEGGRHWPHLHPLTLLAQQLIP